eukprot:CAMPEP_0204901156 /NCGR_PEP_ID=MMETSP1397-20131031/2909_1 /ASSEMBLY_ACC=CAM_ASM_000891 /TAXON_ID=49980 /ORGANISM="Climacostomum Climacostomum virens, Strain Stock W-24" /LENGTH=381 /DNA_ID=CAMNT_0052069453 /DNA_START=478 /DNA_END=1623 /DNA_ORIENTATION=-
MSFQDKAKWLRGQLNELRISWTADRIQLVVKRDNLLDLSFTQVMQLSPRDVQKEFYVVFEGEAASDAGGVTRVWLNLLTENIFSQEVGLFQPCNTEVVSYSIRPHKHSNDMFIFAGRVLGKALLENVSVPCYFSKILFKHLTQQKIELEDLRFLDSQLYKSLVFIKENSIDGLALNQFAVIKTEDDFQVLYELKPGGCDIELDDSNKAEYIELRLKFETEKYFSEGLKSLLEGFWQVVPKEIIQLLHHDELELMLCGLPWIDTTNWREFTVYRGVYDKDHEVIQWFWEVVDNLPQKELGNLLQFCTGSNRMPPEGFSSFKTLRGHSAPFTIDPVILKNGFAYPRAHTCFNRLDLPMYASKETLQKALAFVIENSNLEFGIE